MSRNHTRNIFVVLLVIAHAAFAAEPNYVKTTVYHEGAETGKQTVSVTYSDGLGRKIQTQTYGVNSFTANPTWCLMSATHYDDAGRADKSLKPFGHTYGTTIGFDNTGWSGLVTKANSYFNFVGRSTGDFPYSETAFSNDPLSRVRAVSPPGADYAMSNGTNAHVPYSRTWYFGVDEAKFMKLDAKTDTSLLTSGDLSTLGVTKVDPKYFLTVSCDPDGNFSQELKDGMGRTVKTWASKTGLSGTNGDGEIVAEYVYDILGNILEEKPPADKIDGTEVRVKSTTYKYNTLGQVVEKSTPDAGITKYKYDNAGRLVAVQSARYATDDQCDVTYYDLFGRQIAVAGPYENFSTLDPNNPPVLDPARTYLKSYYDNTEGLQETGIPSVVCDQLTNLRGRQVASVAYDHTGSKTAAHRVVDLFSYDGEGRMSVSWKVVPGKGVLRASYEYTIQGSIERQTVGLLPFLNATTPTKQETYVYAYNNLGQLENISVEGQSGALVEYVYDKTGLLTERVCNSYDHNGLLAALTSYSYNERDWLSSIDVTFSSGDDKKFYQGLDYTGGYTGNISGNTLKYWDTDGDGLRREETYAYGYDGVNRLVSVDHTPQDITGAPNVVEVDEAFAYYNDGRIKEKVKGSTQATGASPYDYHLDSGTPTNRLERITDHSTKDNVNNYLYDVEGNLLVDQSKNMVITYSWRGLPVEFWFYDELPTVAFSPLPELNTSAIQVALRSEGAQVVSKVIMTYDASGNRVSKRSYVLR